MDNHENVGRGQGLKAIPLRGAHDIYNVRTFPIFVAHHGNWDIYRTVETQHCAAIAVVDGCKSTHFGDMRYTRATLAQQGFKFKAADHATDADCAPFMVDDSCTVCRVDHSAVCPQCAGQGFHTVDCPEIDPDGLMAEFGV